MRASLRACLTVCFALPGFASLRFALICFALPCFASLLLACLIDCLTCFVHCSFFFFCVCVFACLLVLSCAVLSRPVRLCVFLALSVCLSLSFFCLSVSVWLSVCLFVCSSVCLSDCPCLPILSLSLPACLFVCLFVGLAVCLSVSFCTVLDSQFVGASFVGAARNNFLRLLPIRETSYRRFYRKLVNCPPKTFISCRMSCSYFLGTKVWKVKLEKPRVSSKEPALERARDELQAAQDAAGRPKIQAAGTARSVASELLWPPLGYLKRFPSCPVAPCFLFFLFLGRVPFNLGNQRVV